ncbi:MAG: 2OG-Fe(II) oxygenase family protein [Hyphomonadaceae bacterium]
MTVFAPAFDVSAAAQTLKAVGRVHIPNALTEDDASALVADMDDARWAAAMIDQNRQVHRVFPSMADALDAGRRNRMVEEVYAGAGENFQYLYDKFSVDAVIAAGRPCPPQLAGFFKAINSPLWLDVLRQVTGDERVARVDCHVSRYRPGHFLSTHNDEDPSNDRLYAYVLNLSRGWRVEWGGLLQFHDEHDNISAAFTPRWNALNMFKVPQPHSVSMVTPVAKFDRLSVTGWLLKA